MISLNCFCSSLLLFLSEVHTVGRKLTILGPVSAVSCQKDTKEEMEVNGRKLLGIQLWFKFPSSHLLFFFSSPLHRCLLLPEVTVLVSSQHCGTVLTALLGERGLEEEEEAVGLVCLSVLEKGQEVCQETCAMSLTRVWMSWRHRGHVSNCKAHSIHIPPCPQGRSSVSAMTSQHSVQQLSRMLTCFSKARRRCLGRMIFSLGSSEAKSLKVLNLTEGG